MKVKDFNLKQTLECGQCFNFERLSDHEYIVTAKGKMLHVRQVKDELEFLNASQRDVEKIWIHYFDLNRDYGAIKRSIIKSAPELREIVEENGGIRILNQDYVETLISFIISQNKNITHIKQIVRAISAAHGKKVGKVDIRDCDEAEVGDEIKKALSCGMTEREYFSFPETDALENLTVEELKELKTGFRAPYIRDAIEKICCKELSYEAIKDLDYHEAKEKLLKIKGVGDKVANCVLLFSLGKRNAFPVDVWINRIMENMYEKDIRKQFGTKKGDKITKEQIEAFAESKFGEYGGYAQQYLFIYARSNS